MTSNRSAPAGTSILARRRALEQLSDQDLAKRCAESDDLAWEALVARYRRLVYAIPNRAGLTEDQVEEVFHGTFARLAERIGSIENLARVRAWMVTTARRLTIDTIRARQKNRREIDDPEFTLENLEDPGDLPSDSILLLERRHLVRTALAHLGERCRRLLLALFYDQIDPPRPWEVIAKELEMPLGSLGPSRARCLTKLLKEYQSLEEGS